MLKNLLGRQLKQVGQSSFSHYLFELIRQVLLPKLNRFRSHHGKLIVEMELAGKLFLKEAREPIILLNTVEILNRKDTYVEPVLSVGQRRGQEQHCAT